MKEIPAIRVFYDAQLVKERVPETSRFHYRKWLRFYLDICSKYGLNQLNKENISHFIDKLQEKHQAEQQQKQAFHAISAYFDIALPHKDKAAPLKNKKEGLSSEKRRLQSTNADWRPVFDALKAEITSRDYSPRTFQTYRGWVRQLQGFTRSKDPKLLTALYREGRSDQEFGAVGPVEDKRDVDGGIEHHLHLKISSIRSPLPATDSWASII